MPMRARARVVLCVLALLAANVIIVANLFGIEYSAYHSSIESTFIAIARILVKYPGQWSWWPFWNGGLPFENVYLPFLHWVVALFSVTTGLSAARSFHMVSAGFYILGATALFWMALELSGRVLVSLCAALAYSCLSLSAILIPLVRADVGGAMNLRRLHDLVAYGEAPHTVALALLPIAIVCFSRAMLRRSAKWTISAGLLAACVALSNAFGIVDLAIACFCWLIVFPAARWWQRPLKTLAIGLVTYAWISPWLNLNMIRAIRNNSISPGGDGRVKLLAWFALVGGFALLWLALHSLKVAPSVRFFALFAYFPTAFVAAYYLGNFELIQQPWRYAIEMDMALLLCIIFTFAEIADRFPARLRMALAAIVTIGLLLQIFHATTYARGLIHGVDPSTLDEYRIAKWLDKNRPAQRAYISSSSCFMYNVFTDNPQLIGGHDQHTVNQFIEIVSFTILYGMNAGDRDADYSIFWLKAFGAHLISVSGPTSSVGYRNMVHPFKFDGVLPRVWQQQGDSIYEVPSRSSSLAHVIPLSAVVTRVPENGLDIAPAEAFVAALEDPAYPLASFEWKNLSEASIHTTLQAGQLVSVQTTYLPGWEALANGRPAEVRGDAIGQLLIEPACAGPCNISLRYTGGSERVVTRALSLMALLFTIIFAWRTRAA